jgi:hypothetical protein
MYLGAAVPPLCRRGPTGRSYFANLLKKTCKPETVIIGSHFAPFRDGKTTRLGGMNLGKAGSHHEATD